MSKAEIEAIARGREAWDRLQRDQTWEDWMLTGNALEIGRGECFRLTHTNDVNSKHYRDQFGKWLEENGFHNMDKSARKRLFECMAHRAQIETWRATLTLTERLKLNHPQSVLRKWQASSSAGKTTRKPAGPGLRDENIRLQSELDSVNEKVRKLEKSDDRGPLMTRRDKPEDMVKVLVEFIPASKLGRVANGLLKASKEIF